MASYYEASKSLTKYLAFEMHVERKTLALLSFAVYTCVCFFWCFNSEQRLSRYCESTRNKNDSVRSSKHSIQSSVLVAATDSWENMRHFFITVVAST